jgi:hypothetical protein
MKKSSIFVKKKNMKNLLVLLSSLFVLTGCYKPDEWNTQYTSLGGEYVVERVTLLTSDQSTVEEGTSYYTGDLYVNPNGTLPLDAIEVGITRWHIDNSMIAFNPVGSSTGQTLWLNEYVLSRVTTPGGDEVLSFNIDGTVKKFKIVDCTLESLTLRSTGQWAFGSSGPYESVVIKFTRIGP